jgi:hypothetical protein
MGQAGGSESIRKDAFPIATSTASVGRVKRLLKVSDQMQPELERDQSFATWSRGSESSTSTQCH